MKTGILGNINKYNILKLYLLSIALNKVLKNFVEFTEKVQKGEIQNG